MIFWGQKQPDGRPGPGGIAYRCGHLPAVVDGGRARNRRLDSRQFGQGSAIESLCVNSAPDRECRRGDKRKVYRNAGIGSAFARDGLGGIADDGEGREQQK